LKEKVVKLSSYARQAEMQKAELLHQVKSQVSVIQASSCSFNPAPRALSWRAKKHESSVTCFFDFVTEFSLEEIFHEK
jgi:hypothetical protein